jgi:hypothetical protein
MTVVVWAMTRLVVAVSALIGLVLALSAAAEATQGEWRLWWVNPRKEEAPPNIGIEVYSTKVSLTRGYAEEDGGYTLHVYLKRTEKVIWGGFFLQNYSKWHESFAWKVVRAWNESLKFAAENYEWGRHLSKLRLKFYTDENVSLAPHIDVLVDASQSCWPIGTACTHIARKPILIIGSLHDLGHELGHALGLGHGVGWDYGYRKHDWRGWETGGYPVAYDTPEDTFVLYALAVRWGSLRNSTAGSPITFPNDMVIRYRDVKDRLGPLYSYPGMVWAYYYTVLSEGGEEHPVLTNGKLTLYNQTTVWAKPFPKPGSVGYPATTYGGTLCIHPLDWTYKVKIKPLEYVYSDYFPESPELPLIGFFDNGTALLLHGIDIQSAIVNSTWQYHIKSKYGPSMRVFIPLKYFSRETLEEFSAESVGDLYVIDSLGPAWDKVGGVSYRGGRVCLEGLRDRVLVEFKVGRAYEVEAPVEPVLISGAVYRDRGGSYWVLRGSQVRFKPINTTYSPVEGVRYVWRGLNETVTVDGPLNASNPSFAKLWRKQYLVEVDSPYPFEGVGWFDEGSKVSPKPVGGYVDLGNGTGLALKGFVGYNGTEVVVDRPLKLKPVWERVYRVDMVSRYIFSEAGKYVNEGKTIFTLMPRVQDFGNGTKIELANMTAYGPSGEIMGAWNGVSGDRQMGLLKLTVDRPLRIVVDWKVYHRLIVSSPVNSYEAWVLNGTVHRLDLPEKKLVGSDTLMVLKQVKMNGKPHQGLEVTVTSPTSVEALYQRKLMVTFMVDAGKKHLVEPNEVVLERDSEVEVYRPPFTYVGEGTWSVSKVTYLGGDITVGATIEVNIAGMKTIPSRLRAVEVTVVDLIGIPVPYASVKVENVAEVTGISGTATLPAIPPWDFKVTAIHTLGWGSTIIRPNETAVRVTAGVSPYTIALLATVVVLGVIAWRRRVSQR